MGSKPSSTSTISNNHRVNLLVYGYIHDWNKHNIDCKLPEDLIKSILIFYQIDLKFDTNKVGRDLYFENNDKIVKIKQMQFGHEICLLNQVFSDEMCNKFDVKYIVRHSQDSYAQLLCNLGYLIHDVNNENISKLHFDYGGFGEAGGNGEISSGVSFQGSVYGINDAEGRKHSKSKVGIISKFQSGDIIKLLFCFKQDKWEIYHNDNFVKKISLNGNKTIIPGVGIKATYCWVEIMECNFY